MIFNAVVYEQIKAIIMEYLHHYPDPKEEGRPTLIHYLDKHPFYEKSTYDEADTYIDHEAYVMRDLIEQGMITGVRIYFDHHGDLSWEDRKLEFIRLSRLWKKYRGLL